MRMSGGALFRATGTVRPGTIRARTATSGRHHATRRMLITLSTSTLIRRTSIRTTTRIATTGLGFADFYTRHVLLSGGGQL